MPPTKDSFVSKFVLSFGLIIVSVVYAVWQSTAGAESPISQTAATTPAQSYKAANDALLQTVAELNMSAPGASPIPSPTTAPTPTPSPAPVPQQSNGQYANGTYVGNAVDAYYGTVQVKAVITSGRLADVQFLQHPSDRSTSRYINDQAMPLLTQEAIQAQSARVNGVSGATFTSQAFQESLTSALALAKK
ncbi:MAG: FMN-binding protein [Candidatus Pacebacteria bacterium]|nr:FMN-binding protein [Candidatus Paceibacterota bacterium]